MQLLLQFSVLIYSFALIFIWQNTLLVNFTTPLLGALIVLYLILAARKGGKGFLTLGGDGPLGIFSLNAIIFILIFTTGAINSPLFFLLYFLSFGIAFIFEPRAVFIFAAGAFLMFVPDLAKGEIIPNLIKTVSIFFIAPLAFFLGRAYKKSQNEEETIEAMKERSKEAADTITEDIEELINDKKQRFNEAEMEKMNEVLEETEDLRAESTNDQ